MTIPDEHQTTLLVVDDMIENIEIMNSVLSERYRVLFATNGSDALTVAQEQSPDLILLDVVMPDMNGYQVCERLQQDPLTREIPVIFVTAKDQEEDEEVGLQRGAVDYLTKPVHPGIVKLRVGIHLELKRCRDHLAALSMTDGLTGIANRRRFDECLNTECLHAARSRTPLSLILIDVDHFKAYNDHYGHQAGDHCLKTIAQTLADGLTRRTDLAARYGGEEFACVLPATDHTGALAIAEKLRERVASQQLDHVHSPTCPFVTISIGVATFWLGQNAEPNALIEKADRCLYEAKQTGRNRVFGKSHNHGYEMGGEIKVEGQMSRGSEFIVTAHVDKARNSIETLIPVFSQKQATFLLENIEIFPVKDNEIIDLTQITGLDVRAGFSNVNNDLKIYKKILFRMLTRYRDVVPKLQNLLLQGDGESAQQLAHTLKGMTGVIGAKQAQAAASNLESAVEENCVDQIPLLMTDLSLKLEELMNALDDYFQKQGDTPDEEQDVTQHEAFLDTNRLRQILKRLGQLIDAGDAKALEQIQTLKDIWRAAKSDNDFFALVKNLEEYEFENARKALNTMVQKLGLDP